MSPIRVAFLGTAHLAATILKALIEDSRFNLVGVISQPDRPQGRSLELLPTPVRHLADSQGIPVFQPLSAKHPDCHAQLAAWKPDIVVVAAYGQILPQALLDLPPHGCINVHTSLLPRWRGAAPIAWAIASGDPVTGVTLIRMDAGMDTGPILAQRATAIADDDTGASLHDRLAILGSELLLEALPKYVSGEIIPQPQPTVGITHARKLTKEDGKIDWSSSAQSIAARIRGFTPWPGAYTFLPGPPRPIRVKILSAQAEPSSDPLHPPGSVMRADKDGLWVACGAGALLIRELQPESSRHMSAAEFCAGHQPTQFTT